MTNPICYKIPTIKLDTRDELVDLLERTMPEFVFEKFEEVLNPVGRQWNLTITTKISAEDIGIAIVEYKEFHYDPPLPSNGIISSWLRGSCPFIKNFYKGLIIS
jgi:hypothetical protein